MIHWYAFQSKARKERLVCEQLGLHGIGTFFPCIRVQPSNPRARRIKPYFPGYIFGRLDLEHIGRSILDWIPGAIRIVSSGDEPVPIPDLLISTLRRHLESLNDLDNELSERYQQGDVVVIDEGPFGGYEAIFNAHLPGRDRVEVLLKMLQGSRLRVELPVGKITLKGPPFS